MKTKKNIQYLLEIIFFYFICQLWKIFPLKFSSDFGAWLARTIGTKLHNQSNGIRNLDYVFPNISKQRHKNTLNKMWDHLGRVCVEYVNLFRLNTSINNRSITIKGIKYLKHLAKPALFFSAHIGNWALPALVLTQEGIEIIQLYRKFNNPYIDNLIKDYHHKVGIKTINKGMKGIRESIRLLKEKKSIIFLMDQKLREGISIPFFNRPAMTAPAIVKLAKKFNCPIIPVQSIRINSIKHKVIFYKPFYVQNKEPVDKILIKINKIIEYWIIKNPSQWLWIHQRWDKK